MRTLSGDIRARGSEAGQTGSGGENAAHGHRYHARTNGEVTERTVSTDDDDRLEKFVGCCYNHEAG